MSDGPNFKRLMVHKMALDAVPPGGGLGSAVRFITEPGRMSASAKDAREWVSGAIQLIRTAAEPNPWKSADDEAIAGELLRQIEERKKKKVL